MNYTNFLYGTICSILSAWVLFVGVMLLLSVPFIKAGSFLIVPYIVGASVVLGCGLVIGWYAFRVFFPKKEEYII